MNIEIGTYAGENYPIWMYEAVAGLWFVEEEYFAGKGQAGLMPAGLPARLIRQNSIGCGNIIIEVFPLRSLLQ